MSNLRYEKRKIKLSSIDEDKVIESWLDESLSDENNGTQSD